VFGTQLGSGGGVDSGGVVHIYDSCNRAAVVCRRDAVAATADKEDEKKKKITYIEQQAVYNNIIYVYTYG